MDERVPMTPRGYAALKAELQRLISVERPANIKDIEEAIAHGDLSENAEYHAAKERQAHIAGHMASIDDKLGRAQVIETKGQTPDKVRFGDAKRDWYERIVGEWEDEAAYLRAYKRATRVPETDNEKRRGRQSYGRYSKD